MAQDFESAAVILTAVEVETRSIRGLYPNWKRVDIRGDHQNYFEAFFERDGETHRIITCQQDVMGMTACTALALKAAQAFRPRYLIMCGIAAGISEKAAQMYGDVIVPDVIWDYSTGKFVGPNESEIRFGDIGFLPRPQSVHIDPHIIDIVRNSTFREDNEFHVHIGPMACGSSVVANQMVVDKQVLALFPNTMGLDMESYSVAYAAIKCSEPSPKALVIKSISDFANSDKSDEFQKFAAYTSSNYLKYLLENHLPL